MYSMQHALQRIEVSVKYTITERELTTSPISQLLCGNFIELGYGNQAESMRSEMLFNRGFEPFFPYQSAVWDWYGLSLDPSNSAVGHKQDWSGEDWYHSAYEHNPWFAAPGNEGPLLIDDEPTFLVAESPLAAVYLSTIDAPRRYGSQALRIRNSEKLQWAGVAQGGKYLRTGETYDFRGWFKSEGTPARIEIRLCRDGDWDQPLAGATFNVNGKWSEQRATLQNPSFAGRGVFCVFIEPGATVLVDDFSLQPSSSVNGWRSDVINVLTQLRPTVMRFPGGCFASFYDWRSGCGPLSDRAPEPSYFWGGMNDNEVGTAEFADLCRSIGSEMLLCVNMFHPKKRNYLGYVDGTGKAKKFDFAHFTCEEEGIKLATDWVAYCNALPGDHPAAALRASHGHPAPFGVRYWEMDNETSRWFAPEEYAKPIVRYSRAMKAVDPTITIGMMIYDHVYSDKLDIMLDICGRDIDFLADRGGGEARIAPFAKILHQYNAGHSTNIKYCNTEWLPDDFNGAELKRLAPKDTPRTYFFNKWRYALNIAPCMMTWQRYANHVLFVNFNNLANTHGQCAIETAREGAFLSAAGMMLELFSNSPAAWPLEVEGYKADDLADIQVQAALDIDRKRLVVYVLNLTDEPRTVNLSLRLLPQRYHRIETTTITGSNSLAYNSPRNTNTVYRSYECLDASQPEALTNCAPPLAFVQLVLS